MNHLRYAQQSFKISGVIGIAALLPLFFMEEKIGLRFPPVMSHPEFFYGALSITLVWQFVFLLISKEPILYRPFMPLAFFEKGAFVATIVVLYVLKRVPVEYITFAAIELAMGVSFFISYLKVKEHLSYQKNP